MNDDGTQCVEGLPIPVVCAKIVRNDDGTYDRVAADGSIPLKWTAIVKGKDF